jgi:predicted KAP-like P-loop ATPase
VFQLVKANADFPNLVYLLLFQRDIVEKNLEKVTSGSGKDFLEKIVQVGFDAAAQPRNKTAAEEILKQLFPRLTVGSEERYYRQLRVCHSDVFDRYFLLSLPEGDISQADLDTLLALTKSREQLVTQFRAFEKRGVLPVVLDRLEAYKQEVDQADAVPFLAALFDIGDDLPERQDGMWETTSWMHASRIIRSYLMKEPDMAKRSSSLSEAVRISEGLYLATMTVALETDSHKENRIASELLLDDEALNDLQAILVEKIRKVASSGKLAGHSKLGTLLGVWAEWAGPDEPKAWVENLTQTSGGVFAFLEAMNGKLVVSGSSDLSPREYWYIQLKPVERFIDPETLAGRLEKLKPAPQALNEFQLRAVKAFERAITRRRSGKPDGVPFRDWEPDDEN